MLARLQYQSKVHPYLYAYVTDEMVLKFCRLIDLQKIFHSNIQNLVSKINKFITYLTAYMYIKSAAIHENYIKNPSRNTVKVEADIRISLVSITC